MSFPRYEKYKDSGIGWLGSVPFHWGTGQSRRLFSQRKERAREDDQQLTASQKHGVIYQRDFMELEGQKVVQVIHGADILKHVEPNDFVISMRSFQGGIEWCGLRGCISSAYVMLVPCEEIDPGFFRYLFKSKTYIQALQSTSNLVRDGQALRYENFTLVDMPLVPRVEQVAIAVFLDRETAKIDALVEEQQRLIELLKEKRQAVISHAVTKGLNPNAPMKDSGVEWLGEVPAHWSAWKVSHAFDSIGSGTTPPSDETEWYDGGTIPWVTTGELRENLVGTTAKSVTCEAMSRFTSLRLHPAGSLVMAMYGATIGRLGILGVAATTNQACCVLSGPVHLRTRFVFFWLSAFKEVIIELFATGGGQPNINQEVVASLRVPAPSLAEQDEVATFLDQAIAEIDSLTDHAMKAMTLLQERRTALISAAVTGKIDVRSKVPHLEPAPA